VECLGELLCLGNRLSCAGESSNFALPNTWSGANLLVRAICGRASKEQSGVNRHDGELNRSAHSSNRGMVRSYGRAS
jgi:hypothetical protein